jgi:hypothetical protein
LRFAYSFLYRSRGYPPDWYLDNMKAYIEGMLPQYVSKYLPGTSLYIGEADYAYLPEVTPWDWRSYFERVRNQVTWGQDAFFVISDLPYQEVSGGGTAGEDYYLAHPNWGWISIADWDSVQRIADMYYNADRWKAMQLGLPWNTGINSLATVGHEMMHAVLLKRFNAAISSQIDGGELSGIVFLDDALNPVSNCSNMVYAVQRIASNLPYNSNLGAYRLSNAKSISCSGTSLRSCICNSYLLR